MTKEMQSSVLPAGSGYDDCRPRYWTEEKVIKDANGKATLETIAKSIGCTSYYADGEWVTDIWSLDTGLNSPEAISPFYQNILKTLADPENSSIYVMKGCGNTLISALPNALGVYIKLKLSDKIEDINNEARNTANMLTFSAASAIAHSAKDIDAEKATESLNLSKQALITGDNYTALAGYSADKTEARELYGKAYLGIRL